MDDVTKLEAKALLLAILQILKDSATIEEATEKVEALIKSAED